MSHDLPLVVAEAALARVPPSQAAYARSDLFERRRELGVWAEYVSITVGISGAL